MIWTTGVLHGIWWTLIGLTAGMSYVFGINSLNFANYNVAMANMLCFATTMITCLALVCCYIALMFRQNIFG